MGSLALFVVRVVVFGWIFAGVRIAYFGFALHIFSEATCRFIFGHFVFFGPRYARRNGSAVTYRGARRIVFGEWVRAEGAEIALATHASAWLIIGAT